jgi:hypothetical protein
MVLLLEKKMNFEEKRSNLFEQVLLIAQEKREEKFGQAKSCFAAIQKICKLQ